jgi:hypothetical protein
MPNAFLYSILVLKQIILLVNAQNAGLNNELNIQECPLIIKPNKTFAIKTL